MYYHRLIVSFTKNNSGRAYMHITVDIPQKNNDMFSYPNEFTKYYIIPYGIEGAFGNIDPDRSFDYHTAFDVQSSKVVFNVPIDSNNNPIRNVSVDQNPSSVATFGLITELRNLLANYFYYGLVDEIWDFKMFDKYVEVSSGSSSSGNFSFNGVNGLKDVSKRITFPTKNLDRLNLGGLEVNNYTVDIPLPTNSTNLVLFIIFYFWSNNNFRITRYDTQNNNKLFEVHYDKISRRLLFSTGGRNSAHNLTGVRDGSKLVIWLTHTRNTVLKVKLMNNNILNLVGFGTVNSRNQKISFYTQGGFLNKVMIGTNTNLKSDKIYAQEIFV